MKFRTKGFKTSDENPWTAGQVREFAQRVLAQVGGDAAWAILSERMRRAFVAEGVLSVARSQDRDTVPINALDALLYDLGRMIGLADW